MTPLEVLARSAALWNRRAIDLRSDEIVAQIMDRGSPDDWRALYALARGDAELRHRIAHLAAMVAQYLPNFWLAAMRSLGEPCELGVKPGFDWLA